jgi:hypothetical protein
MRATAQFCQSPLLRWRGSHLILVLLLALACAALPQVQARDKAEAEKAARDLAKVMEKEGFEFRAEVWQKDLDHKIGKAVKMQLFKGNDYRFCIAVPPDSGVFVVAAVLDLEGQPAGMITPVQEGWGCILSFKPKKTGVYVVAIHQADEGKHREVPCAMITGYK